MDRPTVTVELPPELYADLEALASEDQINPVEMIARLLTIAHDRRRWRRELTALREQIARDGGLQVGTTRDEVVERLRQTRHAIFETEYAHLYR